MSITPSTRKEVEEKYGRVCYYCKKEIEGNFKYIPLDHIHPESKGGNSRAENLRPVCLLCNTRKSNLMLDEWEDKVKKQLKELEKEARHKRQVLKSIQALKKELKIDEK